MKELDAQNLAGMINHFTNKEICPCFEKIEVAISDLSPIGDLMYEIFLFQAYSKAYEMGKMQERYFITAGRGETMEAAMVNLSNSTKIIR